MTPRSELRCRSILVFWGRITISLRSEAQHPKGEPKARGICALTPKNARFRVCFLIGRARTSRSPEAALSPRRATHLFLLRQNKVSQKKATLVPASLRCAAGNLRCSVQPGSRSNSLRSDNRGPLSVRTSAPRRIHKGWVRIRGVLNPLRALNAAMLLIAAPAHIHWDSGLKYLKFDAFKHCRPVVTQLAFKGSSEKVQVNDLFIPNQAGFRRIFTPVQMCSTFSPKPIPHAAPRGFQCPN